MPLDKISSHLQGLEGYIHAKTEGEDELIYGLGRLHYVRLVLGCVIEHKEESEAEVRQFLFQFNAALNGLMFLHDCVWDWTSEALCGPR